MLMSFLASHEATEMEFAVSLFEASMRKKEVSYNKRNQMQMRVHGLFNMRLHEVSSLSHDAPPQCDLTDTRERSLVMAAGRAFQRQCESTGSPGRNLISRRASQRLPRDYQAAGNDAAKAETYTQLLDMQWANMVKAFPWRHRTQTPTRFDGSIDVADSPPQPWPDWESDPRFEVCRALEEHKDEIIAEYRAHVGGGETTGGEAPDVEEEPTTVKGWLGKVTKLSELGALEEDAIDEAMDDDSPMQALKALVYTTEKDAAAAPPPPPQKGGATLFTGNHPDISIVGSAAADAWQYLYVKQSGSKGKTGQLEDETCAEFPKTCALLHSLPSVMWMYNATRCTDGRCPFPPPDVPRKEAAQAAGVAAFYKLTPGTVVPMHNGPTNQVRFAANFVTPL